MNELNLVGYFVGDSNFDTSKVDKVSCFEIAIWVLLYYVLLRYPRCVFAMVL